ncbi:MAG: (Na+)-NQR maturation NqrM [Porticoccaceae bacterium]|jgi:hypothetical protein
MLIFFITLAVLLSIIAAMSVGVLMGRKPISGSCGGVGAALGEEEYICDICGGDPNKCEENGGDTGAAKNLGYNAAGR